MEQGDHITRMLENPVHLSRNVASTICKLWGFERYINDAYGQMADNIFKWFRTVGVIDIAVQIICKGDIFNSMIYYLENAS